MKRNIKTILLSAIILALFFAFSGTSSAAANVIDWSGLSKAQTAAVKDALKLGIVKKGLLADADAKISAKDMAGLLKAADNLFYGKGRSVVLQFYYNNNSADAAATRMDAAGLIYEAHIEHAFQIHAKSYQDFCNKLSSKFSQKNSWWLITPFTSIAAKRPDGTVGDFDIEKHCKDFSLIKKKGNPDAVKYVTLAFNKMTDDRIMTYYKDYTFRPSKTLSVADAVIIAYNYYYSLEPDPVYTDVNKVGTYNKKIITDKLLIKNTTLPDASNQKLPAWKGVNTGYMETMAGTGDGVNFWITEAQIKAMSDMGANFLRLWISFGAFEGPAYGNKNQVNMYYLEHLDQIVAWCMKYDIHIQFSIVSGPGLDRGTMPGDDKELTERIFTDKKYREQFLLWYRMLAKRYAALPNKYTSINLMNEPQPVDDQNYADTFAPIIKAIWEEAPGRVIVADIMDTMGNITGEAMAKLGVALSRHTYDPSDIFVVQKDTDPARYENAAWPYDAMPAVLYSQEGAGWCAFPDESLWKSGSIIKGDISGSLNIMVSDIVEGNSVLCVKADDKIIYQQTPEYVCPGGNIEKDNCYTEKPVIISIPENTKQIELSCTRGRLRLTSVVIERKDSNTVYIPLYYDGYMGTPPVTAVIDKAGSFKSNAPAIDAQKVLNTKNRINSILETKQLADRYGVGFMIGEVGMYGDHFLDYVVPDKTVFAYYKDILTTLDKYDIPWATGWLIDRYGPLTTYPYFKDRTYQKLQGAESYYLDMTMFNLFKGIMGS